jgi:hypothetical protein
MGSFISTIHPVALCKHSWAKLREICGYDSAILKGRGETWRDILN